LVSIATLLPRIHGQPSRLGRSPTWLVRSEEVWLAPQPTSAILWAHATETRKDFV